MPKEPPGGRTPPPSKAEYVYAELVRDIRASKVKAGAPLRAAEVASRLGVSITPVREALRRLERDGLVTYEAHHGATVVDLSPEAVAEFYAVRAALEGLGARLAAPRAAPEQLARLRAIHQAMLDDHAAGRRGQMAARSEELHLAITDIGGPAFLGQHARDLRNSVPVPTSNSIWHDDVAAARHLEAHARLIAALEARDGDAAERVMVEHINWSAERRVEAMPESG